jgi:hypothetical protein
MPLAIAALGLTAVGTGMGIAGNAQSQDAMNRTRAGAVAKQSNLNTQAQKIAQGNIDQNTLDQANADMNKGQTARQTAWDTLQKNTVPIASALPATTGTGTGTAAARAGGAAQTWNQLNAGAKAREGAYGDWQTQQAVRDSNTAQKLGVVNNFAQGDARVLPIEMEVASHSGDQLSGWGQIVSSLGMLTGLAGMAGLGAHAAATGVSATQSANVAAEMAGQGLPGMTGSAVGTAGAAGGLDSIPLNLYTA